MPKQQVEQSLADLAIAKISESTPELLNYLLGFEILESNEENSRVAGLLAFRVGNELIYAPVLFLNGQVRACGDILYLKSSDTFIANSRAWVSYLTSRSSGVTGDPESGSPAGVPSSALRIFNRAPEISNKRAELSDMFEEFLDVDKATADVELSVPAVLESMGKHAYRQLMTHICDDAPEVLEKLSWYYDAQDLMIEFPDEPQQAKVASAEKKELKLKFAKLEDIAKSPADYTQEQKEAAFVSGFAVIDKRAKEEKSELFSDDYREKFSSPSESGFYTMVNSTGELVDVFIARNPFVIEKNSNPAAGLVVIDPGSKEWYLVPDGEQVFVRNRKELTDEEFKGKFEKFTSSKSAEVGKTYVAIGENLQVSAPFEVVNKIKSPEYTTLIVNSNFRIRMRCDVDFGCYGNIRLIDTDGTRISYVGDTVLLPKGFRLMEVDGNACSCTWRKGKSPKIIPGSASILAETIRSKGVQPITLTKSGGRFVIRDGTKQAGITSSPLSKAQTLASLVAAVGLDVEDAKSLMSKAASELTASAWVKKAEIYNGMPFPEADSYSGDELGIPEQWGVQEVQEVPMNNPEYPDVTNNDLANFDRIKQEDLDYLSRAADSNNKQVFDPAMIGIILKTNRTQSQIDKWLPDLVGALDKLCRLLLLFYWKNADVADSYGKDEMAEFEDVLLNNIKNMGTIVLFLKQRAGEAADTKIDALAS